MLRVGYKYKIFQIDDNIRVCIRCQNHFNNDTPMEGLSNLFVLLEWNTKHQSWTKDLDMMTTVLLNKEITDNASNFNRWTMQSILCGVQKMRFAFVQRTDIESSKSHKVVGMTAVNPNAFAKQLNLNITNCWAILKDLVTSVLAQEVTSAEYLYIKDPVGNNYRLIHMIKTENEADDDDDEDDGF